MNKKIYSKPQMMEFGNIEAVTRGPIFQSTLDGLIGQGNNDQIGCQPGTFQGPSYKICQGS